MIAAALLDWFEQHGRHDLPWQQDINPYRVWVSEIMLQQTQVKTVIPYYQRFMLRFPDIQSLARAEIDDVLHHWTGLGYYARGRNLHKTAKIIDKEFNGQFPDEVKTVMSLPGIGRSTAAAILAISFGQQHSILDGNVKRVLSRLHAVEGWPGDKKVANQLWQLADQYTPEERIEDYTQAIMDLGATVCTRSRPDCPQCPLQSDCVAHQQGRETEFPNAKPKKDKPVRKTIFLLMENSEGGILLQQRPPSGIWGGLWCFPEVEKEEDVNRYVREKYGFRIQSRHGLQSMRHSFSHFHLDIQPMLLKGTMTAESIAEPVASCWYKKSIRKNLGLAAPVKKLLEIRHDTNNTLRKAG